MSTPARYVRRTARYASAVIEHPTGPEQWLRERLLATGEQPLRLLAGGTATLAVGLLAMRL